MPALPRARSRCQGGGHILHPVPRYPPSPCGAGGGPGIAAGMLLLAPGCWCRSTGWAQGGCSLGLGSHATRATAPRGPGHPPGHTLWWRGSSCSYGFGHGTAVPSRVSGHWGCSQARSHPISPLMSPVPAAGPHLCRVCVSRGALPAGPPLLRYFGAVCPALVSATVEGEEEMSYGKGSPGRGVLMGSCHPPRGCAGHGAPS